MQEIPRTADHAPSRTLYTWRVDATAAAEKLAADLYKAALNVRLRLEFELNQQSDVSLPLADHAWSCYIEAMHSHLQPVLRSKQAVRLCCWQCAILHVCTSALWHFLPCPANGITKVVLVYAAIQAD